MGVLGCEHFQAVDVVRVHCVALVHFHIGTKFEITVEVNSLVQEAITCDFRLSFLIDAIV